MNVLFLTYDFPYPTTSGGKTRAYNLLKFSRQKDIAVYLHSFIRSDFNQKNISFLTDIGIKDVKTYQRKSLRNPANLFSAFSSHSIFYSLYFSPEVMRSLQQEVIDKKIDLVHCESLYTAYYLQDSLTKMSVKTVFGTENIEYKLYEMYAKDKAAFPLKPLFFREAIKIQHEEEALLQNADAAIAVTEEEASIIRAITNKPCAVIPNGVDPTVFAFKQRAKKDKTKLLFIGDFSYFPNVDAINYFYKNVFHTLSDVSLTIIGKKSTKLPFSSEKNISTIEFVEDIKDDYYASDIFIAPMQIGGGTNFKIIEAMSTGLPVVALSQRLGGLKVEHNKHLLIANTSDDFLHAITLLQEDKNLYKNIANNARSLVEENFAWENIGRKLGEFWKTV